MYANGKPYWEPVNSFLGATAVWLAAKEEYGEAEIREIILNSRSEMFGESQCTLATGRAE